MLRQFLVFAACVMLAQTRAIAQQIVLTGSITKTDPESGPLFQRVCPGCKVGTPIKITLRGGKPREKDCKGIQGFSCPRDYRGIDVLVTVGSASWTLMTNYAAAVGKPFSLRDEFAAEGFAAEITVTEREGTPEKASQPHSLIEYSGPHFFAKKSLVNSDLSVIRGITNEPVRHDPGYDSDIRVRMASCESSDIRSCRDVGSISGRINAVTTVGGTAVATTPAAIPELKSGNVSGPALIHTMLVSLRDEVARAIQQYDIHNGSDGQYIKPDCDGFAIKPQAVDLNHDAIPEVALEVQGRCVGAQGSGNLKLFVYNAQTQQWRDALSDVSSSFAPLPTRNLGFADLMSMAPGMTNAVWRFNGEIYRPLCVSAQPGVTTRNPCSFQTGRVLEFAQFPDNSKTLQGATVCQTRSSALTSDASVEQLFRIFAQNPSCIVPTITKLCESSSTTTSVDVVTSAVRVPGRERPIPLNGLLEGGGGGGISRGNIAASDLIKAIPLFSRVIALFNTPVDEQGTNCTATNPSGTAAGVPTSGEEPPEDDNVEWRKRVNQEERTFEPKELETAEYIAKKDGRSVKAVKEQTAGGRNADALLDDVDKVEFKHPTSFEQGNIDKNSGTIKDIIEGSLRQGGQARHIIVDVRQQPVSVGDANQAISRIAGMQRGRLDVIRIIGDGFDLQRVFKP